ncbi:response regulator [Paenibacillus sp. sptzw28]|uniref:response regulator n=1 Tax=Paenibacillus sp. sptzw28 TaxID=715179 RepID=UPI001C6F1B28|nr:response regulator [Paenibacillus sp. sptzw28]QYR22600.1 response regulator [Paenibacillus sp. sptzw28]
MFSLMIVEDERWEREGLVEFLDWQALGIEVIGTAFDGLDGFEKALTLRPDIIITDIRMPGMNGLEMAGRIREQLPDVRFVVLTGYNEFDYTREAIFLHVDDYVLKPVEEEDMRNAMARVLKECELSRSRRQDNERLLDMLQFGARMAAEKRLAELLHNRIDEEQSEQELLAGAEELRADSYDVLVIAPTDSVIREETVRRQIGSPCFLISCEEIPGATAVILPNPGPETVSSETAADLLIKEWRDVLPSLPAIGIGMTAGGLSMLKESYRQALNAAKYGLFYGHGGVITAEWEKKARLRFSKQVGKFLAAWHEMSRQLRLHLLALQEKEVQMQLEAMIKSITDAPGAYVAALLKALIIELSVLADGEGGNKGSIQQLLAMNRLPDMHDYVRNYISDIMHLLEEKKKNKDKYIIDKVIRLIDERYGSGELSLTVLADEVFVSPNHLNTMFKKITGRTVHQYLADIRMSKAEELLRTTKLKVSEIAGSIGMSNISYFCSIFKQEFGMSPGEYQELMQRQ